MWSLLLAVVFSGWRRQIQRAASGFVIHSNHNHQRDWCPGHASILHRNPLLWLHLWSLSSCGSSSSCHTLIIILMLIVLFILILINVCTLITCVCFSIFFWQGSEIITVSAKDGDQGNPNPIFYSILNGNERRTTTGCFTSLFGVLTVFHLPGSDGVFDINSTTGCITFTTYPSLLRKELYEIKVKVKI